jgi:hypothetical protein
VRKTGDLFRWGLTCLLLAPLGFIAAVTAGGSAPIAWAALGLIVLGGVLNAAALVRGVRRIGSGDLMTSLDGMTPADRAGAQSAGVPADPIEPRQRIIFADEGVVPQPRPGARRRVGLAAATALLGLIAFGAYTLAVEQPLAIAQGQLSLDEVYAVWGAASRVGFTLSLTIWIVLSLAIVLGVAVLALMPTPAAERILNPRRMLAAACIAGSAIVVASIPPYFTLGISLPDDMPFFAGGVQGPGSLLFGLTGVALSAVAILLTVPRWQRARR